MEYHIADWDEMSLAFSEMFQHLGEVTITKEHLSYSSNKPHAATAMMLTRDGQLIASMPLHNIDSRFGWQLNSFQNNPEYVIAQIEDLKSGLIEEVSCGYLVGCDGGQSTVRKALDIKYVGKGGEEVDEQGGTHTDIGDYKADGVKATHISMANTRTRTEEQT